MVLQTRTAKRLAGILAAAMVLSSCASYQLINPQGEDIAKRVRPDHTVTVFTTDGRKMELRILGFTAYALVGEDLATLEERRLAFQQIGVLEKKPRRSIDVSAIAFTVGILVLIACAEAGSDCVIR